MSSKLQVRRCHARHRHVLPFSNPPFSSLSSSSQQIRANYKLALLLLFNEERHRHTYKRCPTNHTDEPTEKLCRVQVRKYSCVIRAPSSHGSWSHSTRQTNECTEHYTTRLRGRKRARRASRYLHVGRHGWIHSATGRY